jgi:hypothetical protein
MGTRSRAGARSFETKQDNGSYFNLPTDRFSGNFLLDATKKQKVPVFISSHVEPST